MARRGLLALALLALAAGTHAARSQTGGDADTGMSLDGLQLEPIQSTLPDSVANFDIAALEPLLPLLDPKIVDPKLLSEAAALVPVLDVKWLEAVLPYTNGLDPDATGKLARALLPELMKIPNATLIEYVKIVGKINPKTVGALAPALGGLDMSVVGRLIAAVNGMNPDVIVTLANTAGAIQPAAWDALLGLAEAGVPAINLAGAKLSMLPISVPAPQPFADSVWGKAAQGGSKGGLFGWGW